MKEHFQYTPDNPRYDIQQLIGNTLRWGVTAACVIAFIGGIIYLARHGGEPMKDYSQFVSPDQMADGDAFTTLGGIFRGVVGFTAVGWIQMGVVVLLLTPIMRVALSLFDFLQSRDWLYSFITAVVLAIIIVNSLKVFE